MAYNKYSLLAHLTQLTDSLVIMTLDWWAHSPNDIVTQTTVNRSIVVTQGPVVVYDWVIQSVPLLTQSSYGSHQPVRSQWVSAVKITTPWHQSSDPPLPQFQPITLICQIHVSRKKQVNVYTWSCDSACFTSVWECLFKNWAEGHFNTSVMNSSVRSHHVNGGWNRVSPERTRRNKVEPNSNGNHVHPVLSE